jgi:hypothetical protein
VKDGLIVEHWGVFRVRRASMEYGSVRAVELASRYVVLKSAGVDR